MSFNKILDKDLQELKNALEIMIEETKIQYAEAFGVLKSNDEAAAAKIFEHDQVINEMQNKFTTTALWKISKQNLVAKDLRLAVGGILISKEIEIIADYAKNLAKFFSTFKPTKKYINSIIELFSLIMEMLDGISHLFGNVNENQNEFVRDLEEKLLIEVENVYDYLMNQIFESKNAAEAKEIGEALKQIKNLGRAGDHLFNVQEIVNFIRLGKFVELSEISNNKK
ncbi:phosphate transport system regulator PhoU [Williamsoniiplasma somnilux]|uniref:Phosphate transport system regulator PhoU n=1 Tax=Williamsoniiplasma somnilux TaxID=215578 RepID=A0A2K8P137_9MOLU|nr:phosphate signaling complex protein PhoU [Williamsoniiplasma somnilux]ATZ18613.1 phosphate transport system regulator PhoU [Williamsoniiplasma somnilux]